MLHGEAGRPTVFSYPGSAHGCFCAVILICVVCEVEATPSCPSVTVFIQCLHRMHFCFHVAYWPFNNRDFHFHLWSGVADELFSSWSSWSSFAVESELWVPCAPESRDEKIFPPSGWITTLACLLEPLENRKELVELQKGWLETLTYLILVILVLWRESTREKDGLAVLWRCDLGRGVQASWLFFFRN